MEAHQYLKLCEGLGIGLLVRPQLHQLSRQADIFTGQVLSSHCQLTAHRNSKSF